MDASNINQGPTEIEDLEDVSEPAEPPKTLKLEDIVRDVLDSRPAVLAARAGAGPVPFDRSDTSRWSLPSTTRKRVSEAATNNALNRRSRSLHGRLSNKNIQPPLGTTSDIVITDIEVEGEAAFQRNEDLRKSSALLRHRLAER